MEFNYTANTRVYPATLLGATPLTEAAVGQSLSFGVPTQFSGTPANVEGRTVLDGTAISQEGLQTKQTTISDNHTHRRPRSSNVSDEGRPGLETCRQRRRFQTQYTTREEQTRATVNRAILTVAATLTEAVGRSTDDTFRSSCISLLQVHDTLQLKDAITRKLWEVSREKCPHDGVAEALDRRGCVEDSSATQSSTSSQNIDSFDDLALNLADSDVQPARNVLVERSNKKRRTENCPVHEAQGESLVDDWFSDIVDG